MKYGYFDIANRDEFNEVYHWLYGVVVNLCLSTQIAKMDLTFSFKQERETLLHLEKRHNFIFFHEQCFVILTISL